MTGAIISQETRASLRRAARVCAWGFYVDFMRTFPFSLIGNAFVCVLLILGPPWIIVDAAIVILVFLSKLLNGLNKEDKTTRRNLLLIPVSGADKIRTGWLYSAVVIPALLLTLRTISALGYFLIVPRIGVNPATPFIGAMSLFLGASLYIYLDSYIAPPQVTNYRTSIQAFCLKILQWLCWACAAALGAAWCLIAEYSNAAGMAGYAALTAIIAVAAFRRIPKAPHPESRCDMDYWTWPRFPREKEYHAKPARFGKYASFVQGTIFGMIGVAAIIAYMLIAQKPITPFVAGIVVYLGAIYSVILPLYDSSTKQRVQLCPRAFRMLPLRPRKASWWYTSVTLLCQLGCLLPIFTALYLLNVAGFSNLLAAALCLVETTFFRPIGDKSTFLLHLILTIVWMLTAIFLFIITAIPSPPFEFPGHYIIALWAAQTLIAILVISPHALLHDSSSIGWWIVIESESKNGGIYKCAV